MAPERMHLPWPPVVRNDCKDQDQTLVQKPWEGEWWELWRGARYAPSRAETKLSGVRLPVGPRGCNFWLERSHLRPARLRPHLADLAPTFASFARTLAHFAPESANVARHRTAICQRRSKLAESVPELPTSLELGRHRPRIGLTRPDFIECSPDLADFARNWPNSPQHRPISGQISAGTRKLLGSGAPAEILTRRHLCRHYPRRECKFGPVRNLGARQARADTLATGLVTRAGAASTLIGRNRPHRISPRAPKRFACISSTISRVGVDRTHAHNTNLTPGLRSRA